MVCSTQSLAPCVPDQHPPAVTFSPQAFEPAEFEAIELDGGILRPWRPSDATALVDAWGDPEIARWNQVPPIPTVATAERWIEGWQQRCLRGVAIDLVLADGPPGSVMGEVGLSKFAEIPGGGRGALVGYWLLPQARGKGLAVRALQATLGWARAELGLSVMAAKCHKDNNASQAVVAGAGFEHERNDDAGNQLWFSRPRGG